MADEAIFQWEGGCVLRNRKLTTARSGKNSLITFTPTHRWAYGYPLTGVGQFKTEEIAAWTKQYDPSRLVNPASGGNHYPVGDILDLHQYPAPQLYLYDGQRATVLGEYGGGIGWANKEHLWEPDRNWGYVQFNSEQEVTDEYVDARSVETTDQAGFLSSGLHADYRRGDRGEWITHVR